MYNEDLKLISIGALAEFYDRILSQDGAPAMRNVVGRAIECATVPSFIKAQYKHPVSFLCHEARA